QRKSRPHLLGLSDGQLHQHHPWSDVVRHREPLELRALQLVGNVLRALPGTLGTDAAAAAARSARAEASTLAALPHFTGGRDRLHRRRFRQQRRVDARARLRPGAWLEQRLDRDFHERLHAGRRLGATPAWPLVGSHRQADHHRRGLRLVLPFGSRACDVWRYATLDDPAAHLLLRHGGAAALWFVGRPHQRSHCARRLRRDLGDIAADQFAGLGRRTDPRCGGHGLGGNGSLVLLFGRHPCRDDRVHDGTDFDPRRAAGRAPRSVRTAARAGDAGDRRVRSAQHRRAHDPLKSGTSRLCRAHSFRPRSCGDRDSAAKWSAVSRNQEYRMTMKRVLAASLALSLLGTTAAQADSWHGGWGHHGHSFGHGGGGLALGIGLGILGLGLLASSSHRHYYDDGYYGGPPPGGPGYGGGYPGDYGYGPGYAPGNGYGYGPGYDPDQRYGGDDSYPPADNYARPGDQNGYGGDNRYGGDDNRYRGDDNRYHDNGDRDRNGAPDPYDNDRDDG